MESITKHITPEEDGTTVRHILKAKLHFSSRAISRLTRTPTGILVNGQHARTTCVLHAGDTLTVETGDQRQVKHEITPGNWPLPIVWEDEHLLVVDKPAGMTAHASNLVPDTPTVAGALAWQRGNDFLFHAVNRLDKGTTGLMVVAKSGYIHDQLRRALHSKAFYREYRAVCVGRPSPDQGTVDAPIGRDESSLVARKITPNGMPAVSHYEVLESNGQYSLLKLVPETGRTHQLRLHMASLGCPLVGDWLYGEEDRSLITRPALHSFALHLTHPVTGERLELVAPLPPEMLELLKPPDKQSE